MRDERKEWALLISRENLSSLYVDVNPHTHSCLIRFYSIANNAERIPFTYVWIFKSTVTVSLDFLFSLLNPVNFVVYKSWSRRNWLANFVSSLALWPHRRRLSGYKIQSSLQSFIYAYVCVKVSKQRKEGRLKTEKQAKEQKRLEVKMKSFKNPTSISAQRRFRRNSFCVHFSLARFFHLFSFFALFSWTHNSNSAKFFLRNIPSLGVFLQLSHISPHLVTRCFVLFFFGLRETGW